MIGEVVFGFDDGRNSPSICSGRCGKGVTVATATSISCTLNDNILLSILDHTSGIIKQQRRDLAVDLIKLVIRTNLKAVHARHNAAEIVSRYGFGFDGNN